MLFTPRARILAQSAVAVSHTGNTTETVLATIPIGAGIMGPNGRLRISALFSITNNGNTKSCRIRMGGTGINGQLILANTGTTTANIRTQTEVANRGVANSQVNQPTSQQGWGTSSGAIVTGAVDTDVAFNLYINALHTNAADTIAIESYLVELLSNN
jgi:hypothetical protein